MKSETNGLVLQLSLLYTSWIIFIYQTGSSITRLTNPALPVWSQNPFATWKLRGRTLPTKIWTSVRWPPTTKSYEIGKRLKQFRCQLHQHFIRAFFVWKCFAKLLSNYNVAWKFFGKRISAQKLVAKCWWNWLQGSISSTFYEELLRMQILRAQKRLTTWLSFLHFWDLRA